MLHSLGWLIIITVGVSISLSVYVTYPALEAFLLTRWQRHISYCQTMASRLFWDLPDRQIRWLTLLPSTALGMMGLYITFGFGWLNTVFTIFFTYVGWASFPFALTLLWKRRLSLFDTQLVDALNLMANSLKSGLNLSQSIGVLVREMPNPIAQEFALVLSQKELGLSLDDALEKMLDRVPSDDLSIALHSVLILRETGGDLSETFDVIAGTIRERRKVDGKIKSLTAQGRMQGLILFIMPFAFGFMLYLTNPAYIEPMFQTQLGWLFILIMLVLQIIGGIWMRRVAKIEV